MSAHSHRKHDVRTVECAVVTVSDTRTEADDASGRRIRELLTGQGHSVAHYLVIRDEPSQIDAALASMPATARAVIFNGGTGLAPRDTTFEAISRRIERPIPGFGELFRMLSFEQVGPAAMLSRAIAGVVGTRVVFALPGSTAAVELAMMRLILPELGHLIGLLDG